MTVRAARLAVRSLALLVAFAAVATWASAQSPRSGVDSAVRLAQLKRNRALIEDLVDDGVRMSARNTHLDRADECFRTTSQLSIELHAAVSRKDADRVAEIGDLLAAVVENGFVPNLREAEKSVRPDSPGFDQLVRVRDQAQKAADGVADAIPADGELAKSGRVKAARDRLAAAAARVAPPKE